MYKRQAQDPEALLHLADGADAAQVTRALEARGWQCTGEIPRLGILRCQSIEERQGPIPLRALETLPGVFLAELNGVGEGGGFLALPNDTYLGEQWHHANNGANGGTTGADIQSVEAWDLSEGAATVTIAVLDTGIALGSAEFAGRLVPGYDFVNSDPDPSADHPHGVRVTGLAAANANNQFGVAGVDWRCKILPIKILNQSNLGTVFNLAQGLDHCAVERPEIVSMSLINYPATFSLRTALRRAREAGCILISCGGNSGAGSVAFPGASEDTITIAASDRRDNRASFSSFASEVDFIAPGVDLGTVVGGPTDTFMTFSGCSAATPVAAGIVGLLMARHPILSQDQAYELLRLGAEDQVGRPSEDVAGYDVYHGHGRLNAYQSLLALEQDPTRIGYFCTPAQVNSSGRAAKISARGTVALGPDDLTLQAVSLPPGEFGFFVMGTGQDAMTPPGSNGPLCITGGTLVRILPSILSSGQTGAFELPIGTTNVPGHGPFQAGDTWGFQAWFRDAGSSNFTDALALTFE